MDDQDISIARIRHFFDFESPYTAIHLEEITFFNKGETSNKLHIHSRQFRHYLEILDYNNERLQFHGALEDYFDVVSTNTESGEGGASTDPEDAGQEFEITIDFPQTRPFPKNEFRTISLRERIDVDYRKAGYPTSIELPFDQSSHTYVYIKKVAQYNATITTFFRANNQFFELDQSQEKEFLGQFETTSYFCIYSFAPMAGCYLQILIQYKLRKRDSLWFYGGIALGLGAVFMNLFLLINSLPNCITTIGAISTIGITYLTVTKGWIFTKDIDDVVEIYRINKPIKTSFTVVYLALIIIIFIELCIAILFGYHNVSSQNLEVIIRNLYQKIYILS